MGFLDTYSKKSSDKATLKDMLAIREMLSDDDLKAIPQCLYTNSGSIDIQKLVILAWGIARKEKQDITADEVAESISATDPAVISGMVWDIVYFYTNATREDIERIRNSQPVTATEEKSANPTPSETRSPDSSESSATS